MKLNSSKQSAKLTVSSDYKDDGTNILLDANENAYGPGLALSSRGELSGTSVNGTDSSSAIDIDLFGLNRYPDPYVYVSGPVLYTL